MIAYLKLINSVIFIALSRNMDEVKMISKGNWFKLKEYFFYQTKNMLLSNVSMSLKEGEDQWMPKTTENYR